MLIQTVHPIFPLIGNILSKIAYRADSMTHFVPFPRPLTSNPMPMLRRFLPLRSQSLPILILFFLPLVNNATRTLMSRRGSVPPILPRYSRCSWGATTAYPRQSSLLFPTFFALPLPRNATGTPMNRRGSALPVFPSYWEPAETLAAFLKPMPFSLYTMSIGGR